MKSRHVALAAAVALLLVALPQAASGDVKITYLGAFKAFNSSSGVYNGGLTFYPGGNGGVGSLFISRGLSGSGKELYELAIPPLVITTDVNALNMATALGSYDLSMGANGLVWRSTDDKLYYSLGATGSGQIRFRSINRDGTGESAQTAGAAWLEGGFANCQLPDAWAAAKASGKNIMTIAATRGIEFSAVDPWNATMVVSQLWKYGTNPQMTGYDFGDAYNGIAWVEFGTNKDFAVCGSNLPGPAATFWFMRVVDFENRGQAVPQPYKIESVQDKMFTTAKNLSGIGYDSVNRVLYAYEAAQNTVTIVHAWQVDDAGDDPPSPITDLAASDPQFYSITLNWSAPLDDHGPGGKAAGYDVRYSTSPITEANWASAAQAAGEPTPSGPSLPEQFVVTGLTRGTLYYFAVKSWDIAPSPNYSAISNVVSLTTDDDVTAPAAVSNLSTSNVLSQRLQLHWSASGDDGLTGVASSYDVRYSTSPITDEVTFAAATPVTQNLTPKAPGQAETIAVTGLTPSQTYHFALKVADEMPNWSGLSNVATVTMNPLPTVPPAAVNNLAVSGSDALSADLAWTASADSNGSPASSYEIRYSTSTITEANWAAATLVPNVLAPQPLGSTEAFAVIGLQPSTTYFFALKVRDEVPNVSAISNVATCTTPALPDMTLVTTVSIVEKDSVATTNYPVTLSMGFKQGDVADNVTVRAAGLVLPTQTDVKVRWADGSVRHAMVSFIIPQLQADQTQLIEFLAGGTNYSSGWVTKDQLLAGDFEATLALTYGSLQKNASARQMVQGVANPEYWLKGGICTEFVIRDYDTRYFGQLGVSYRVRVYPSVGAIRVSTVVDNTWIDARANITYSLVLSLGKAAPQVVYSKTDLKHFHSARWHKVFWQGTAPSKIETRYNLAYWIAGGFVPNYDTSIVVSASTAQGQYDGFNSSAHDIMGSGQLTEYFPTTGGRWEIGPYPQCTSLYLCSMDRRLADVVIGYGDLSGTIPMHFRESDPARVFYRHPVSLTDRPTIWMYNWDFASIHAVDKFPEVIGDVNTPWTLDRAHQPSLAYIPYLITGDLFYLEEMHFWASYDFGASDADYRGAGLGYLRDQIRGNAWALREVVDAAAMTPPEMPEKADIEGRIANNINAWNNAYIVNGQLLGNYPTVRYFGASGIDASLNPATCSAAMSSWQTDYMIWSLVHAYQMGYPTLDLVHWSGQGLVDRFGDWPGWNRYRGTVYVFPSRGKDAGGNSVPFPTWADVNSAFISQPGPTSYTGENANSYVFTSRGVMALVANLPNGLANWTWLDSAVTAFKSGLPYDTRYAFVPPLYLGGDINNDSHVDVVDLLYFVDTFGMAFGDTNYNPAADFNGDFSIDVVDLLTLVENFGL